MQNSLAPSQSRNGCPGISAVILDYGQVLARRPTAGEFGRMAEMFNVSFELFYEWKPAVVLMTAATEPLRSIG